MSSEAYQEAERRIAEAARLGSHSVDLSDLGLADVPNSLGSLSALQHLDLGGNQLAFLPNFIEDLSALQHLDLAGNQLALVPDFVCNLLALRHLCLSHNNFDSVPDSLGNLTALQHLDLGSNQLASVPDFIGRMAALQHLDLSANRLSSVPDFIGNLSALLHLDLSVNRLASIPNSFSKLAALQHLDLSYNKIASLPEFLGDLSALRHLDLGSNRVASVPDSLGNLLALQSLDLESNELAWVPDSLGRLSALLRLHLSENNLAFLPDSFGSLTALQHLDLGSNCLTFLPDSLGNLSALERLYVGSNELTAVPASLGSLTVLQRLDLSDNKLASVPDSLGKLSALLHLDLGDNKLTSLPASLGATAELLFLDVAKNSLLAIPESFGNHPSLMSLILEGNRLTDLPDALHRLAMNPSTASKRQQVLSSIFGQKGLQGKHNPWHPTFAAIVERPWPEVRAYLEERARGPVVLNEAKLVLVGEGKVGKTELLKALRGLDFTEDNPTTHGIEVNPVKLDAPDGSTRFTLNGWDFGGQPVYRPTHQLFFTEPAIYLVVWAPRAGMQQGLVKDWIKLVKYRAPGAKILVVATHCKERQADIDRQEIIDQFGSDTVVGFHFVDNLPDANGIRPGIAELKDAISRIAADLPGVGERFPASWQRAINALKALPAPFLRVNEVLSCFTSADLRPEHGPLLLRLLHNLGHIVFYENDAVLKEFIVLKPDWLAKALSYVFDDPQTRADRGLISTERLGEIWAGHDRPASERYPPELHPLFLRFMERFDISYKVAIPERPNQKNPPPETNLIAQLVSDEVSAHFATDWPAQRPAGEQELQQVCRIVDKSTGQAAPAEGLLYRLIVRLHKWSMGREDYRRTDHWRRGLVLDGGYRGRAFIEQIRDGFSIRVRGAAPVFFLSVLTEEVQFLVDNFWEGLRVELYVPCSHPCGKGTPGSYLFSVQKLFTQKLRGHTRTLCGAYDCDTEPLVDQLLLNATTAPRPDAEELLAQNRNLLTRVEEIGRQVGSIQEQGVKFGDALAKLDANDQITVAKVEDAYRQVIRALLDEAKEGPRLFSFVPLEPKNLLKRWTKERFQITLWCEHSRLPLNSPALNGPDDPRGVYELEVPRVWVQKAAPTLKLLSTTLGLIVPMAASAAKLELDGLGLSNLEKHLDLQQRWLEASTKLAEKAGDFGADVDRPELELGTARRIDGGELRQLHAWLKEKDPSFGGLCRVENKRGEILWVHEKFRGQYM